MTTHRETMLSRLMETRGFFLHGASVQRIGREDLVAAYLKELAGPLSEWQVIQAIKSSGGVGIVTAYRYRETLIGDGRLVPMKDGRSWLYRAERST